MLLLLMWSEPLLRCSKNSDEVTLSSRGTEDAVHSALHRSVECYRMHIKVRTAPCLGLAVAKNLASFELRAFVSLSLKHCSTFVSSMHYVYVSVVKR
jgi:hypothetical protein